VILFSRKTAVAIIRRKSQPDKFLVVKNLLGYLDLPGGGVKRNETSEVAVKRELKEELNIQENDILSNIHLGNGDIDVGYGVMARNHASFFLIEIRDETVLKGNWEIVAQLWLSREEAATKLSHPATREMLALTTE
jgi:8-oxo-dGTP pyrophosphatase MutT (NUDIX family)